MKEYVALAATAVPATTTTNYPEPFAQRVAKRQKRALGDAFGLSAYGVNLVTLPPGTMSALRHRHTVQEEFIYVLDGELTLVHDAGEIICTAGMCAGFVPGGTAHHLLNRSEAPASFLVVGDRRGGDCGIYPDDDLKAAQINGVWRFTRKDGREFK
jgi:uncharacterized cupin superfamily protein